MKKFLFFIILSLMVFVLVIGCGKKADEATDKVPVETKAAEMMDSTRLDSLAGEAKEAIDGAIEDTKDAAGEAVDSLKAKVPGM